MSEHWIFENAVPAELLRAAVAEFPDKDWGHWHKYADGNAVKYGTRDRLRIPPACWEVLCKLFAHPVGEVTEIDGLFPDVELYGAGLHLIPAGGHLGMHLDSDHHPLKNWKRELSGVLFLEDNDGGELMIGDTAIAPKFNRLAIFQCTDESLHGVPNPPARDRRTLSVFWWTLAEHAGKRDRAEFN